MTDSDWSWLESGVAPLTGTEPKKELDPDACVNGGPCPGSNCGRC